MHIRNLRTSLRHKYRDTLSHFPDHPYEKNFKQVGSMPAAAFGTDLAVIIHLYYPELWPGLEKNLKNIPSEYLLIITYPFKNSNVVEDMFKSYDKVALCALPNRGRDILPFMFALKAASNAGYRRILKLHTKKSPHRTDGKDWSDNMVSNLLPNKRVVSEVLNQLNEPETGLIGPRDEYLSLSVNFEANGTHMTQLIKKIYGITLSQKVLQAHRQEYGFFAGSMFWANTSTLMPLINSHYFNKALFEKEAGQVDATFAHALERVFSLVAEIQNKSMYQVSEDGLQQLSYASGSIPDWSNVYVAEPKK